MKLFQKATKTLACSWLKPRGSLIPNHLARESGTMFLLVKPGMEQAGDLIINPLDGRFYEAPDHSTRLPRLREIQEKPECGIVLQLTTQVTPATVYMHNSSYTFEQAINPVDENSMPHFDLVQGTLADIRGRDNLTLDVQ